MILDTDDPGDSITWPCADCRWMWGFQVHGSVPMDCAVHPQLEPERCVLMIDQSGKGGR